jgi:spore germination protein KA
MVLFKTKKSADPLDNGKKTPRFTGKITSEYIEKIFNDCYDFVQRRVDIGGDAKKGVTLCFIDGLVSGAMIAEEIIRPMTSTQRFGDVVSEKQIIQMLTGGLAYSATVKLRENTDDVVNDLLSGFCAIVLDREHRAVTFEVKSSEKRSVDVPKEEKVVKGSKDAFVEIVKTNTTLVRKKLRNPDLKIRETKVGRETQTSVAVVYIDGFTNTEIVKEVEQRLAAIDTDGVLTAAVIEDYLVDNVRTPFPQLISTERPDKFCLNILEGRVGILVDGLPIGYLAPGTFAQFFKVPEDVANHHIVATGLTILRYIALVITLFIPAFYVAVAMYHQEMIPTKLLNSMIDAKQSVPFPTAVEVVGMLIAFELLQEAGLRLPNPVGETVSIIGALIVGQSAVEAHVVSPVVVIVVAFAGIAGYTMPNQDMGAALRIWRFLLVFAAILAGLYGLVLGGAALVYHLCTLECFGVAYMTPFADSSGAEVLRAISRRPMTKVRLREPALKTKEHGK